MCLHLVLQCFGSWGPRTATFATCDSCECSLQLQPASLHSQSQTGDSNLQSSRIEAAASGKLAFG